MKKYSKPGKPQQKAKSQTLRPLLIVGIVLALTLSAIGATFAYKAYAAHSQEQAITRLSEMSNSDFGTTFDEVVANVQAEMPEYEIIFVFDQNGQKLIEYTLNQRHGVSLPDEALKLLRQFRGLIHAHNHPFVDSGPSDGDLGMLDTYQLNKAVDELVIIGKEHTYHLNHKDQDWPTYDQVVQYMFILYNAYGPLNEAGLMDSAIVDGEERIYFTTSCLQKFAEDLGYTYNVRNSSSA